MSGSIRMTVTEDRWPFRKPFRIASGTLETVDFLTVTLRCGDITGQGEGIGVLFRGETLESMREDAEGVRLALEGGADRTDLQMLLHAGGARNAIDCALWDLECKMAGVSIWEKTGLAATALQTVYTIGIDDPPAMMADAQASRARILKIKIAGPGGVDHVRLIRKARPDARLIVDANRSLSRNGLEAILGDLAAEGVEMLEQPLQPGEDKSLVDLKSPIPLCADESCLTRGDLGTVASLYDMINIKLDKTGGLTEALALAKAAQERGLSLMVGCMAGTSLSMAPAFVIGQMCSFVDLDGPLLMASDRDPGMTYLNDEVLPPRPDLWG
jgi:L-alanine-DL-glutamate epimerase-like enolase superfamily enzyme